MAELQANGVALSDQDKADARSGLGLGSAATAAASDFATAAQGTDAREWTAATVLQAEAEAGTDTARKAWTVQRVWQAAAAWWAGSAAKTKLDGIASGATVNAADATLLARANHTGTQTASTISDFSTAADARIAAASLDALGNVSAPSPINGQVLQFNGTAWVPSAVSGAGTKTLAVHTPMTSQPPATAFATLDTRNSIAVLDFDDATEEGACWVGVIPEAATLTSGISVRIHWTATSATSGACRWGVQFERAGTDIDADSFDTATEAHSTTNGTSGIETITTITATSIDSLVAGDRYRVRVYRDSTDATNDTMTGDAELIAVELRQVA